MSCAAAPPRRRRRFAIVFGDPCFRCVPQRLSTPVHTLPGLRRQQRRTRKRVCVPLFSGAICRPPVRTQAEQQPNKKKREKKCSLRTSNPRNKRSGRLKNKKMSPPAQPHVGRDRNVPDQLFSSFPEIIDIHKCGLLALARGGARLVCR